MAQIDGFDTLAKEIEMLAERFDDAIESKPNAGISGSAQEIGPGRSQFISFKEAIQRGISSAMFDAVHQANTDAKQYIPDGQSPGIRQRSEGWQGDRYSHQFYTTNDLVVYHEFGTGEHGAGNGAYEIRPNGDYPLAIPSSRWTGPSEMVAEDDKVHLNFVVHPGVEANHFTRNAVNESIPEMKKQIAQRIENVVADDL